MDKEEAREQISAGVRNFMEAMKEFDPKVEFLDSWAMVISIADVEDVGVSHYAYLTSSARMPSHVFDGLILHGLIRSRNSGPRRD